MNFLSYFVFFFILINNNLNASISFSEVEQAFYDDDRAALSAIFTQYNLNPNITIDHNKRLLVYCLQYKKLNLTRFLIQQGADMALRDYFGLSATAAAYYVDHRLIDTMLTKNPALLKAPVNTSGDTLVLFISRPPLVAKDIGLIRHLLTTYGASPLVRKKQQDCLVNIAFSIADENYFELIKFLIEFKYLPLGYTFNYRQEPTTVKAHIFEKQLQERLLPPKTLNLLEKQASKQRHESSRTQSGMLDTLFE